HGAARVIVELDVPWQPEGMLRGAEAVVAQRQQVTDTQQQFVTSLSQTKCRVGNAVYRCPPNWQTLLLKEENIL
ncbi:MAG: hypothetical protein BWK78_05455, partial [Thiotrichaceae bacterium IS1]